MNDRGNPGGNASPAGMTFLERGGEMGARMRAFDWTQTPLGPPHAWPQSLKTAVRILLDSRYAMWMLWGPELTFFCNDAYLPTVGLKRDWVLGARSDKVWAEIWPDIGPRIAHVLKTGEATWDEGLLLFLERSGYPEETYHSFSYSPVYDDRGTVAGMLCVVTEETERLINQRRIALLGAIGPELSATNAEPEVYARLQRHFEGGVPDLPCALIYMTGDDGRARCVLRAGFDATHPAAPEHVTDSPWPVEAVLGDALERTIGELDARFANLPKGPWKDAPHAALMLPIPQQGQERPAGVFIACLNRYRPLDGGYRRFLELLVAQIASAVANARSYADERRRAEALAEIDRVKTAFFSNVSHEFRTPLTLMMGPLEDALHDPGIGARAQAQLTVAHRNSLRLLKLVNSLLDFSRIEAGRLEAHYVRTDIAELTADLASVFRSTIERAGIAFHVECPPIDADVHVDRDMWEKIVFNLLSNALKHTLHGEIRVTVERVADSIRMSVADTGTGIPEDALPQVFDRFYRVPDARARTHEGSGIGLALVREFTALHGGSVSVSSTLGVGTTFTVTLPCGREHLPSKRLADKAATDAGARHAEAFVEEASSWQPRASSPAGAPETVARPDADDVLLVDDNADMRDYVRSLLSTHFNVRTAADGMEALAQVERKVPDLVLTDVMMPRIDGFGLLKALRADERTREVPVVLLSARAGEESRIEGIDAGADDYLVKPFSARELYARVANNLATSRARRQFSRAARAGEKRRRFLLEFADALRSARTPEEVIASAVERIGRELATTHAGYLEVANGGHAFQVVREWRVDDTVPTQEYASASTISVRSTHAGCGCRSSSTTRRCIRTPRSGSVPASAPSSPRRGVAAGRSPAALFVTTPTRRAWQPDEVALLREAAERTWAELDRARAESALRESEERFRTMADSSPLFVWVLDPAGRTLFANRACREFFGESPEGLNAAGWSRWLHADDAEGYVSEVTNALAEQRNFSVMARFRAATAHGAGSNRSARRVSRSTAGSWVPSDRVRTSPI